MCTTTTYFSMFASRSGPPFHETYHYATRR